MTMNREFTWFTGAAFVVASILGALDGSPRDLWTAVIILPLAFVAALLIAGQPTTASDWYPAARCCFANSSLLGTGFGI